MTIVEGISIQVSLSGYSFKITTEGKTENSGWLSSDRIFTEPEFRSRYDEVSISLFTPKCTLVPEQFFDAASARDILSDVVRLDAEDVVEYVPVPSSGAVLVYSGTIGESLSKMVSEMVLRKDGSRADVLPEFYYMLRTADSLPDYNRIVASYADGRLYLVISQGRTLQLCNSFKAGDFTTAQYFIFLSLKKLQLNPEVSTIYFRTPLEPEQEMSLYRYFKSVETI